MLLIIGRIHIQTDKVAAFQAFAQGIIEEERRVEGCTGFDILQDVAQHDHFVMMEQWRDQAALNRHLDSESYAQNDAQLNSFTASEPNWVEYEV